MLIYFPQFLQLRKGELLAAALETCSDCLEAVGALRLGCHVKMRNVISQKR
jgi:hypothetical protein